MFRPVNYYMPFVIGTVLVPWKVDRFEHWPWLANYQSVKDRFPNAKFFAALEVDARGIDAYGDLPAFYNELGITYWTYMINDGETEVTSQNRWIRIETGRNLVREYAQRARAVSGHHWGEQTEQTGYVNNEAILYADADVVVDERLIEGVMEIDHPLVSVDVPAYGLRGRVVNTNPRIEEHWNTAGFLWVNAPAYYDLVWSHNNYLNLSDDPTFQSHAIRLKRREGVENLEDTYGETWVRKDMFAQHIGELIPVESRGIEKRVL